MNPIASHQRLARRRLILFLTGLGVVAWGLPALAAPPTGKADLYAPRPVAEVRGEVQRWLERRAVRDARIISQVGNLWTAASGVTPGREAFERVIQTFVIGDPETKRFVDACGLVAPIKNLPRAEFLRRDEGDEFYGLHMRLFYARCLTQRLMYDEALAVFAQIDPARVADPATCLFYQAVCQHQLLMKTEGLATLDKLLHKTEGVAESYVRVGSLMHDDLQSLDEQPLGSVSRKMKDSERRLDLGRGGQRVQKVQAEIVESLDEIIKKIEQQAMAQSQSADGQNNGNRSTGPADDSGIKGATAPGNVDPKNYKKQGKWGDLNAKDKSEAQQALNRDFPSNYRQAVEEYFKKLANRPASKGP